MYRPLHPVLLLLSSILLGCQSVDPMALMAERSTGRSPDNTQLNNSFHPKDRAEKSKALASIDHELIKQMIAETPAGAQVAVATDFDRQYTGTLLKGNTGDLELMNSVGKEVVPGPNGQRQCKVSHVPFQSFKIPNVTRFAVISPPPPDFVFPNLSKDSRGVTIAEIVYKDGSHQRLGAPIARDNTEANRSSAEPGTR